MSHFTRGPLAHLRKMRQKVFGFGISRAAAEKASYRRGDLTFSVKVEPAALPEGVMELVTFKAQGWVVPAAHLRVNGIDRPLPNDVLLVGDEAWTVFEAAGHCFARRSYGGDVLLYTKLTTNA